MPAADTGDRQQDVAGVHAHVTDMTGRTLLGVGAPLVGTGEFVEQVLRRANAANRDTLHVAGTRGYDRLAESLPEQTRVVDCSPAPVHRSNRVTHVTSPGDLTGIGMAVARFIDDAGPRPVVTLDSISTLLAYADELAVFRFLSVLAARLDQVDGVGVFLVVAGCHDSGTVTTFRKLVDGRIDIEAERARVYSSDDRSSDWLPR